MGKLTKNQKITKAKVEKGKNYPLNEASQLVKDITTTKFDASVDLAVGLGVDPRKANQMVRGVVTLPHGTGKTIKVLALVTPDKEQEAKDAGADFVKTSTGFAPSGARAEHIKIMRQSVPAHVGVKASGGIKTLEQALQMIEAGADRLGTSSGISIVTSQTNLLS